MSRIPEHGTPCADSAEASDRDLAFARRRDGRFVDPAAYARYRLRELEVELAAIRTDDSDRIERILAGMRDLEEALAPVAAE